MKILISPEELSLLLDSSHVILLDATYGKNAEGNFENMHLPGAQWVNLDNDLSSVTANPAHGGRHPLPEINHFNEVLKKLGVQTGSHIIVYDQDNCAMAAARMWWMLYAAGLKNVQVLNGGMRAAVKGGMQTMQGKINYRNNGNYVFNKWQLPLVHMANVQSAVKDENSVIIDVRSEERYDGRNEPIDPVAGHIPTAINIPLTLNLTADQTFKNIDELKNLYEQFTKNETVIVHCGSGVTACHTLLAFAIAGLRIPSLYAGSWSEWSRNDNLMVTRPNA